MQKLSNKINNFDYYYEMSDSGNVYDRGSYAERLIKQELAQCTTKELIEIKSQLTVSEESLFRYFREYFENLEEVKEPSKLSQIMSTAWAYIKQGLFTTMSEALKAAWKRSKIVAKLKKGVAHFTYRKGNGELRDAIGTLREGNFEYEPKGGKAPRLDVVSYYDLAVQGFRSFRIERLVA